jgi:hypothetical protein
MRDDDGRGAAADEFLRIALALPEVEERVSGSYFSLRVRGKGFGYLSEDSRTLLLKATREEQAALVAEDPEAYAASHSSGRFGWIEVRLAKADRDELAELITEAWRLSAPRSLIVAHESAR